jgi:hypothetical protein
VIAIVDTGPLYAVADADDDAHAACLAVLERTDLDLVVPALVVAEATYLIGRRLGVRAEAAFLQGLESLEIEAPAGSDWVVIAALVERHGDFPLGGTDASIAALADRLGTDLIITLDHRHFGAVRSASGGSYRLLPS